MSCTVLLFRISSWIVGWAFSNSRLWGGVSAFGSEVTTVTVPAMTSVTAKQASAAARAAKRL
jgi:hypothetical protein